MFFNSYPFEPKIQYNQQFKSDLINYFYGSAGLPNTLINDFQQTCDNEHIINKYKQLLSHHIMNISENRQVNHHHCRNNTLSFYEKEQKKANEFATNVHNKTITSSTNKPYKTIVQIGIGGSFLGPKTLYHALKTYATASQTTLKLTCKFIANVDPAEFESIISEINPENTLFIIVSKSGTTAETLSNIQLLKEWWKNQGYTFKQLQQQCVAITCKQSLLDKDTLCHYKFYIDNHIGGRFSTTSVVGGLLISLCFGPHMFKQVCNGAKQLDEQAKNPNIKKNISLLAACIGIYERTNCDHPVTAIIPYSYALQFFPKLIQQLNCESNGKSIDIHGNPIQYHTAPIIIGEPGTNAQHSFFQLCHQGTTIIPIEFIAIKNHTYKSKERSSAHQLLNNNVLSQIISLFEGESHTNPNKIFPGKRPSTLISLNSLTPESVGGLLAFYENKIMFQGFLLNINSFDQEGVSLGKKITTKIQNNPSKYKKLQNTL